MSPNVTSRIGITVVILAAVAATATFSQRVRAEPAKTQVETNQWITEAPSDAERFKRLERYLRGFDQPMWEVGERYQMLYAALGRGNFELAIYHWDKIKITIENGTMKRPARRANAEAMFLKRVWPNVKDAFESGNQTTAWKGFETARASCISCHQAEAVAYINDQPMFTDLVVPSD